jgi:hypothetical protein
MAYCLIKKTTWPNSLCSTNLPHQMALPVLEEQENDNFFLPDVYLVARKQMT